jgi:methionyl-tRNA formyltransferase
MTTLILTDNAYALDTAYELGAAFGGIAIFQSPGGSLPNVPALSVTENIEEIVKYGVVLSLHCRQLFPAELVNRVRCVNVHPGFNPDNRGWFPHVFSLVNGLRAGVTIHEMDERIDHGPIIVQEMVPVESWDTSQSLYARIMDTERVLLRVNYPMIRDATYSTTVPGKGNINTKRDYEMLRRIDLTEQGTFAAFLNRLRALSHGEHRSAYFIDDSGQRVSVRVTLEPE